MFFVIPGLAPGVSDTRCRCFPLSRACARGQLNAGPMSGHHAYQLYAHITWHTWKRVGCIDQAAVDDVQRAIVSACEATGVRVLRAAILADHVHVVASFRPDTCLSDFVRLVKSVAAVRANRRIPGAIRWARGFYAATLHRRDLTKVVTYVAQQLAHHRDRIPQPGRVH